jgi:peptidyl-tRNA hydrolase
VAALKLYLIIRRDLSPAQQAVQAAHAMRAFQHEYPLIEQHWFETSNTLAFLEVEDEAALETLLERARWKNVAVAGFREPDRDNELTALAIGPDGKNLCQKLQLALQRVASILP